VTDFSWLALIPLAPLLGAVYNGLAGSRMQARFGKPAVHLPAILLPAISFVVTVIAFVKLLALPATERVLYCHLWDWLPIGQLDAGFAFIMDPLTLVMCLVVTFVGTLIHVYSVGYMREEPSYWRFFCYLNLFMFAMLVLVLGDNFVVMFVGWEGVGLCSYLLISFWYKEHKNATAGMKAFVVNRIGDFGFVLGVLLLFWGMQGDWQNGAYVPAPRPTATEAATTEHAAPHGEISDAADSLRRPQAPRAHSLTAASGSVTFRRIREHLEQPGGREALLSKNVLGISLVTLIGGLFFLGAMGKSAQIPLYVWLPDAMAGPTPVSALIHAATMVTAGVYMVARLNFLFALSPALMTWVTVFGVLTAVFAATIGFFQYDIKKVLAYSTVSQLGFMFIGVGVGAYWVGIFHLMTHALFKACLFLGSGSVILGCHHEQDMRKMGGLKKLMPVTAWTYFAACCAIAGFPLTAGFFSKDEILWKAFDAGNLVLPGGGVIIWMLGALTALGTSFYMFRSYYMTFSGTYRGGGDAHGHADAAKPAALHAPAAKRAHAKDDHSHGHGTSHGGAAAHAQLPHESPASMTVVLAILGVLSLIGGFVGLPLLWRLPNLLEHWLEPVFEETASLVTSAGHGHAAEWTLMALSVGLALGGWLLARWLYRDQKNPLPAKLLANPNPLVRGVHTLIYNKYYVDELYAAVFIKGVMTLRRWCDTFDRVVVDGLVLLAAPLARGLAWLHGRTDARVVDGAVNGTAWTIAEGGKALRLLQTGRLRTYLYAVMIGGIVLIVLNYLFLP
jgi:NADH-quinone oxidoreductase subunit L